MQCSWVVCASENWETRTYWIIVQWSLHSGVIGDSRGQPRCKVIIEALSQQCVINSVAVISCEESVACQHLLLLAFTHHDVNQRRDYNKLLFSLHSTLSCDFSVWLRFTNGATRNSSFFTFKVRLFYVFLLCSLAILSGLFWTLFFCLQSWTWSPIHVISRVLDCCV